MLLFSALLALSIHLNVSHPEVIIYSQLTSSCHATTTTTTTLILFPPTLNTFFFAPFFNVSPFPAPLLLLPLLLIRPSTTSVDFNYTTTTARNSEQWKFCFWRGAFGCASWCGRRRPSSTKVDLFRWQSTTNSFSRAFSMCRCKYAYVCICVIH